VAHGGLAVLFAQFHRFTDTATVHVAAKFLALGHAPHGRYHPVADHEGTYVTALALGLVLVQWRAVLRLEGDALAPLRKQMEVAVGLMPHTATEYRWWRAIAITAGVCEEVLYRGFLMWFLGHWMSPWLAAIVGGAAFGVGHLYQGPTGMLKTGVTGTLMGLLYAGTGSLLWPIILHAAVDLQGGAMARRVLTLENQAAGLPSVGTDTESASSRESMTGPG